MEQYNVWVGVYCDRKGWMYRGEDRDIRISRMIKKVVRCVQVVVKKKKFIVQFKDKKKIELGYFLILRVFSEEKVDHEMNKTIYEPPP